jgi:hypothetical protein
MYDMAFNKHKSFALIRVFNSTVKSLSRTTRAEGTVNDAKYDYCVSIPSTVCYTYAHRWPIFDAELQYIYSLAQ